MKRIILILGLLFAMGACGSDEGEPTPPKKPDESLPPVSVNLKIGESKEMTNYKTSVKSPNLFTWVSSAPTVCSVSELGILKGVSEGEATITATHKTRKMINKYKVIVDPVKATKILLSKTEVILEEGKLAKITASITPENTTDKTIKWESSDKAIATVEDGNILAVKEGTCTISAISGDVRADCSVTVTAIKPTSVKISTSTINVTEIQANKYIDILIGDKEQLKVEVLPQNAKNKKVIWTSSNPELISITNEGIITAIKESSDFVQIKATTEVGELTDVINVSAKTIEAFVQTTNSTSIEKLKDDHLTGEITSYIENKSTKNITVIGFYAVFKKDNVIRLSTPLEVVLKPGESLSKTFRDENRYKPNYILGWAYTYNGKEYRVSKDSSPVFN